MANNETVYATSTCDADMYYRLLCMVLLKLGKEKISISAEEWEATEDASPAMEITFHVGGGAEMVLMTTEQAEGLVAIQVAIQNQSRLVH